MPPNDDTPLSSRLAAVEAAIYQLGKNDERQERQLARIEERQKEQWAEIVGSLKRLEAGQVRNSDQINRWRGAFDVGTWVWRGLVAVLLLLLGWLLNAFHVGNT